MTWLWVIIIVAVISGIIGYFSSESGENKGANAFGSALVGGVGCGFIILQIFLALLGLYVFFLIGSWLFE